MRSVRPREQITVTLSELSSIWLKYNEHFQTCSTAEPLPGAGLEKTVPEVTGQMGEKEGVVQTASAPSSVEAPRILSADFLRDIVEPYKELYVGQGALAGAYRIMELLDGQGGCPSIVLVGSKDDSEEAEIYSIRDILQKVTLRDHSYRVARIALKLLKETYRDYENLVPKMCAAALGHDLGKIPSLRQSGLYAKADHPLISAAKVSEIFMGQDVVWLNDAVSAIKNHHRQTRDPFTMLLKQADGRARETEVAEMSRDITVKDWKEWFDVRKFIAIVRPAINVVQTGRKWKAFSFGGVVYCHTDLLHEAAKKLAQSSKVIDMTLLRTSDKEIAVRKIVESLRSAGAVSGELGMEYYGRLYEIQMTDRFKKKMFLVPLNIEAFGMASEIEKIKEGIFHTIKGVRPVMAQH